MKDGSPDIIAINNDDYHAKYVGRTADGRQFILTAPFEPAIAGRVDSEFVALYLFDAKGTLLYAKIEDFGPAQLSTARNAAKFATDGSRSLAKSCMVESKWRPSLSNVSALPSGLFFVSQKKMMILG